MRRTQIQPYRRIGPLFNTREFAEIKDPCIVYDGSVWHIYGTGVSFDGSGLRVFHATSAEIEGPWAESAPVTLDGASSVHMAAPGVVYDSRDTCFHMAIQEDFTAIGGKIEYLISPDGGVFSRVSTALEPIPGSGESGLYDPHLSEIDGEKLLTYAGMPGLADRTRPFIPQPDIYLAQSRSGLWHGPWERLGKILDHTDIDWHHNRREHPDYEWGIEGPQLVRLPSGMYLLNATCFLEDMPRGSRQRVFFALSRSKTGPYESLGPVIDPLPESWESGENGHATAYCKGDTLYVFYQARADSRVRGGRWNYGIALFRLDDIESLAGGSFCL